VQSVLLYAQSDSRPTIVHDSAARKKLLGTHRLSLQWIGWGKETGRVIITDSNGILLLRGKQAAKHSTDFLWIEGRIIEIGTNTFTLEGKMSTMVTYINNGMPCEREGRFTFAITQRRKYWRMREINNPCDAVADYVDIYFR